MDWTPFVRLMVAAAFAAGIGLDRELRAKPAGLRTNIVVGVAAAAFAYASVTNFPFDVDESRVAAQIVSGIGFLGGGAIFAAGGKPHGLTTAAALWGSAAAGLNAGIGAYATGLALVIITVVVLWPLEWVGGLVLGARRRSDINVQLIVRDLSAATAVRALVGDADISLMQLDLRPFGDRVAMGMTLYGRPTAVLELTSRLAQRPDVDFLSEEALPSRSAARRWEVHPQ
ncbi:MAG: MgtC/SapB family protein [Actinobacteria bacterium]|nr:MgtC/SapB family protein [Actinomycetota bacterium]